MKANKPQLIVNGKRLDGRNFDELREIKITASVLDNADGSAYIEWGNNKILAAVYCRPHKGDSQVQVLDGSILES